MLRIVETGEGCEASEGAATLDEPALNVIKGLEFPGGHDSHCGVVRPGIREVGFRGSGVQISASRPFQFKSPAHGPAF